MNETIQRLGEDVATEVIGYMNAYFPNLLHPEAVSMLRAVIETAVSNRIFATGEEEVPNS